MQRARRIVKMDLEYRILSLCNGTELILCTDGSFTLKHKESSGDSSCVQKTFLIQCYSNGCVNKVSVEDLLTLRYDYKYSHGQYPLSNLMALSVACETDSICVNYIRNGVECSSSIEVQRIRSHSMIGLKGIALIDVSFDAITGWYLNGDLISTRSESVNYIDSDIKIESKITESLQQDEQSCVINENLLEDKFRAYLTDGRNIPIGQEYAKKVLAQCKTKEQFWQVIHTLLICDVCIYRSPIVEYLNEFYLPHFLPSAETLSSICELLFSDTVKPEKNIEFLYHFKDILTDSIKDKLVQSITSLSQPRHYKKLFDLLGLKINERIGYCIEQSSIASLYCLYEILLDVNKKEGIVAVKQLITSCIDNIDDSTIEGKLIKRLIFCDMILCDIKMGKIKPEAEITKIKAGGYNVYQRLCASHECKKKNQSVQNSITTFVGKRISCRYVATYSNHYFLMASNGIRVLLPKSMSEEVLHEGTCASVLVVYADKNYKTLYATQQSSIDYKEIMQMPLLNNGDVIEVSFGIRGNLVPHKCYKMIKVKLDSYPEEINSQIRYKAKVIHQITDKYHYLVKIEK